MINLQEMFLLPLFKNASLISGNKGINKQVRWLTILELLDDIHHLEKGELLLTTAFDLASSEKLKRNVIKQLHEQELAGVIIQTGYYLEEVPQEMIEQSNQLGFPIIEVPKSVSFSEITKLVHKIILNRQFEEIQFSEGMYKNLTEIALNNEGLRPIAKAISELMKGKISIFDINMNELCSATSPNADLSLSESFSQEALYDYKDENEEVLDSPTQTFENEGYHTLITAVTSKEDAFGYIVAVKNHPFNDLEEIAIKHASTIGALEFIKLLSLEEKDNQLKADVLELLLTGDYTDELTVYSKGEALGYQISSHDTCVVIIQIDDYDVVDPFKKNRLERKLQQTILKKLHNHALKTLFKQLNGKFIILLTNQNSKQTDITNVFENIKSLVFSTYGLTLSVGIGKYYNDFNHYRYSFQEAQESLFIISSVWKKNKCLHYQDLGLYKLLLPLLQDQNLIEEFHEQILGDIIGDEELLETLRTYLEDMKINEAAEKLYIHRHTLKYRLKKIEKLTQREITNFKDRIELELALIINNIMREDL